MLSDRLRLERKLTKSAHPMLFRISKHSFPKMQGELMPMAGVISGGVTPKDKTRSNPFARLKVRNLLLWRTYTEPWAKRGRLGTQP